MKVLLIALLIFSTLTGQWAFEATPSSGEIKINGTSSVHDWTSDVESFTVKGVVTENDISNLQVVIEGKSIKSGKSIMDDKTYDALRIEKYPEIKFDADKLKINANEISGKGTLSIAGVTKPIDIRADILTRKAKSINVKGNVDINMMDYNINPPTAMFGTLKTGELVTIQYELTLTEQ